MAIPSLGKEAFEMPKLQKIIKTRTEDPGNDTNNFWSVKFYPFELDPEASPIFAIANKLNLMVCRISQEEDNDVEVLRVFDRERDEQFGEHLYCSCTWAFVDPDEPLLLGAGDGGIIQVYNVVKGILKTNLVAHGQNVINDLATHPRYPWIFASVCGDTSVRIWDLRRCDHKHESPCVVICGHGMGHRETLLSISWHDSGRYIVTGGQDHRICVWTLPDLSPDSSFWEEISPSQRKRSSDEVRVIHYPHFITSALHTNFVDCVLFWGDLILSKASQEGKIVLWSIPGFNSHFPPPDAMLAPKAEDHFDTRNGFMRAFTISSTGVHDLSTKEIYKDKLPYTRLLEFSAPHCEPFFMRFGLLQPSSTHPELHPVLAIGNQKSQLFFFDLFALEHGYNPLATIKRSPTKKKYPAKKGIATPLDIRGRFRPQPGPTTNPHRPAPAPASSPSSSHRSSSLHRAASSDTGATSDLFSTSFTHPAAPPNPPDQAPMADRERYPLHLPNKPLEPTKTLKLPDFTQKNFLARSVAWSNDGRWCVVVGETEERRVRVGVKLEDGMMGEDVPTVAAGGKKKKGGAGGAGGEVYSVGVAVVLGRWGRGLDGDGVAR